MPFEPPPSIPPTRLPSTGYIRPELMSKAGPEHVEGSSSQAARGGRIVTSRPCVSIELLPLERLCRNYQATHIPILVIPGLTRNPVHFQTVQILDAGSGLSST